MMSPHTPGPFRVRRTGREFLIEVDTPVGVAELATVHDFSEYVNSLPAAANAYLMAASANMLSVLERIAKDTKGSHPEDSLLGIYHRLTTEAIAQAKGGA